MSTTSENMSISDSGISLWPAFGLGLAVAVSNGLARFAYALLLPAMRDSLEWNYAQAGWLNTANALGYVVGAVSGYLLLRLLPPSKLFNLGLWMTVVTVLVTGASKDIYWLSLVRLVSGIGAAWAFSCGGALIADRYHGAPHRRGTATGLFFAGAGLGIVLGGVSVEPLLAWEGNRAWPEAWLMLGVLSAVLSLWPALEARRHEGHSNTTSKMPLSLRGMGLPLLSYFAFAGGYIVYMTFIFAWMHSAGWDWRFSTVVWLVLGISVAVSPFIWRRPLRQWNSATTLSLSCAATMVGTAIPLFANNVIGLLVSATAFGLGLFIAPSAIAVMVRRRMEPINLAKGMTFFTVVFSIGQALGPVVAGWIADLGSLNSSLIFGLLLLALATVLPFLQRTKEID
jgi:predicted MFS family arabinose efflux permease